ncbi:unnamed protein product [Prorocentrum cordatum]|uniref:Uncharacterized protein n=1 Tax=Prorocentrum cordatum TaxID=2364126 RepID=A0ABN9Y0W3_9DINO|nr:unnamed protein product [Polarella glacialis]
MHMWGALLASNVMLQRQCFQCFYVMLQCSCTAVSARHANVSLSRGGQNRDNGETRLPSTGRQPADALVDSAAAAPRCAEASAPPIEATTQQVGGGAEDDEEEERGGRRRGRGARDELSQVRSYAPESARHSEGGGSQEQALRYIVTLVTSSKPSARQSSCMTDAAMLQTRAGLSSCSRSRVTFSCRCNNSAISSSGDARDLGSCSSHPSAVL